MGKWILIGVFVMFTLGILYWNFPSLSHTAFYTPAMVGATKLPVFGISWLLILGVGLALVGKKMAKS
jgi:hypothetical protein